jgi:uncharacterized protein (UPF0218 family)
MATTKARESVRRLKFSSVRRREGHEASQRIAGSVVRIEPEERRGPLGAVGGLLTAAYVAVARQVLVGFEVVQDQRAARRAVALRRSARADAVASVRNEASSLSANANSRGDALR